MADNLILYRFYDANGVLLYIGISRTMMVRLSRHQYENPFMDQVATITLQRGFQTRAELEAAEKWAIEDEQPLHNVVWSWSPEQRMKQWRAMSKLTEDQVREIRRAKDKTARQLAKQYGVHINTIQNIRDGRTWRDVT